VPVSLNDLESDSVSRRETIFVLRFFLKKMMRESIPQSKYEETQTKNKKNYKNGKMSHSNNNIMLIKKHTKTKKSP